MDEWRSYIRILPNYWYDIDGDGNTTDNRYLGSWNPGAYTAAVWRQINTIANSATGRLILNHLNDRVTIFPYPRVADNNGNMIINRAAAAGTARSIQGRDEINEYRRGVVVSGLDGRVGTGLGTNVDILFTPGFWIPGTSLFSAGAIHNADYFHGKYQALPDEVLLHELIHAVRFSNGMRGVRRLRNSQLNGTRHFEEFVAMLLNNIYRSEKRRIYYRIGRGDEHNNYTANPQGFYSNAVPQTEIRVLVRQMPEFCWKLSQLDTPFKPFENFTVALNRRYGGRRLR